MPPKSSGAVCGAMPSKAVNIKQLLWVLIQYDWCPHVKRAFKYTQKPSHGRTRWALGCVQARERSLRGNRPYQHLDLTLVFKPLMRQPHTLCYSIIAGLANYKIHLHDDMPVARIGELKLTPSSFFGGSYIICQNKTTPLRMYIW